MLADILHRITDLLPHPSEQARADLHQQITDATGVPEPETDPEPPTGTDDDPDAQTGVPADLTK